MGINGMTKKNSFRILTIVSFFVYIVLAVIFVVNLVQLPDNYKKEEKKYIVNMEKELKSILELQDQEIEKQLNDLIIKYPMELVIYDNDQVLYQTVPVLEGTKNTSNLLGSINQEAVLSEVQIAYEVGGRGFRVWYSLYHLANNQYLQSFLARQTLLFTMAFLLLVIAIYFYQRFLLLPLKRIQASIAKLENYEFEEVKGGKDKVNEQLSHFASNLQSDISAVSMKHTELEQKLQIERERLRNTITVSRSLVHDLKTPIHQNLLENEYIKKHIDEDAKEIRSVIDYNIQLNEKLMKAVNEVLAIMKGDFYNFTSTQQIIDVNATILDTLKLFQKTFEEKGNTLDFQTAKDVVIHANYASFQLLIHNIITNMARYAKENTEIRIEIYATQNEVTMKFINLSSTENILRMKKSENLFSSLDFEMDKEHSLSSGNGLFLINDLAYLLNGKYELVTNENTVTICVVLPSRGNEQ